MLISWPFTQWKLLVHNLVPESLIHPQLPQKATVPKLNHICEKLRKSHTVDKLREYISISNLHTKPNLFTGNLFSVNILLIMETTIKKCSWTLRNFAVSCFDTV